MNKIDTSMTDFVKTEASVQKLLDLLRCDSCERTLHRPFTTGVCTHTLCVQCCSVSRPKKKECGTTSVCPMCLIPIRPCDVKPHPQLSSLVLVARRLAKLLRLPSLSEELLLTEAEDEEMGIQLLNNKENVASKDDIDFINTDAYCRVESPCPSPGSKVDSKPPRSPLPSTAASPTPCSVQLEAQYTGEEELIVEGHSPPSTSSSSKKKKRSIRLLPLLPTAVMNETVVLTSMPPPSVEANNIGKRSRSRQSDRKKHEQNKSPPSNRLQSSLKLDLIAPLATPEKSCLTENSMVTIIDKRPEHSPISKKTMHNVKPQPSKTSEHHPKSAMQSQQTKKLTESTKHMGSPDKKNQQLRLNSKGESVLHRAAIKNDIMQLNQLLDSGLSPNIRDHAGWTPLHEAALRGHVEAVECLLNGGATADLPGGPELETPLHEAVANCHLTCVRALLCHGSANPNFANGAGLSPLQVCNSLLEKTKSAKNTIRGRKTGSAKLNATIDTLTNICKLLQEVASSFQNEKRTSGDVKETDHSTADLSASALFIERRRLRPVLLGTGLNRIQKSQFVRVARLIHARVAIEMSSEVTHLITGITNNPVQTPKSKHADPLSTVISPTGLTCPRTLKFLFAVLQGCWVLSFDWVETCTLVKMRVEEEGFEVSGCSTAPTSGASRVARIAREAGSSGLFHGFRICLLGNFEYPTPSRSDLTNLATTGGATVFSREISSVSRLASLAIIDDPATSPYCLIDDESSEPSPTTWSKTVDHVSVNQLIALYDPRGSVMAIPEQLRPEQLLRGALDRLRPNKRTSSSSAPLSPPISLLPATWLMDCVAEYAILPAPKTTPTAS